MMKKRTTLTVILVPFTLVVLLGLCGCGKKQSETLPSISQTITSLPSASQKSSLETLDSTNPAKEPSTSETNKSTQGITEPLPTETSCPLPREGIIDLEAIPLMSSPRLTELLRVPGNDRSEASLKYTPSYQPGSPIEARPCPSAFIVLEENHFFICDSMNHAVKEYWDGVFIKSYEFPETERRTPLLAADSERLYLACSEGFYVWDRDTAQRKDISYPFKMDPMDDKGAGDFIADITFEDGQVFLRSVTSDTAFPMDCDFFLNKDDQLQSCDRLPRQDVWEYDVPNRIETLKHGSLSWSFNFNRDGSHPHRFLSVDEKNYLYLTVFENKPHKEEDSFTIRKYSPTGELVWKINEHDKETVMHPPKGVIYQEGKIYIMRIYEKEVVIFRIEEDMMAEKHLH